MYFGIEVGTLWKKAKGVSCIYTSTFLPCVINLTEERGPSQDIRTMSDLPQLLLLLGGTAVKKVLGFENGLKN